MDFLLDGCVVGLLGVLEDEQLGGGGVEDFIDLAEGALADLFDYLQVVLA